jgi:hypothetical protein
MSELVKATLRAAEVLRSMGGATGDPLEALMAFFHPILADMRGRRFDPAEFSAKVRAAYGWNFNEEVAEGFRKAFIREGCLTPKRTATGTVLYDDQGFYHTVTPIETKSERIEESTINARLDRAVRAFRQFLAEIRVSEAEYSASDEQISEMLLSWLLDSSYTDDPSRSYESFATSDTVTRPNDLTEQERYLSARFVSKVQESDKSIADDLQWIASVGLIAELAQDFNKPRSKVKRSTVAVYLDSPVALDLLGTSGKQAASLARTVISRLQKMGATVTLFDQSLRELQNTLKALLYADPLDRYGPTQEAILAGETDEAFLNSILTDPQGSFRFHQIVLRPSGSDRRIGGQHFFSDTHLSKLYNELLSLHGNHREHESRCQHDANAAANIMRLRKGHLSPDMFESGHFFLTRNRAFTNVVRQYCVRSEFMDSSCVGPFINMHEMAASLWLRTGMYADDDIPKRQLLAGCERVLTRNQAVVAEAKRAILSLRQQPQLDEEKRLRIEAILNQDRSMLLIADRVRGAGKGLTDEDAKRILDEFAAVEQSKGYIQGRQDLADEIQRVQAEKAEVERRAVELQNTIYSTVERSNTLLVEKEGRLSALEAELAARNRRDIDHIRSTLRQVNEAMSKSRSRVRWCLGTLSILLLCAAAWKEGVDVFVKDREPGGALYDNYFLIVCAVLPIAISQIDAILRLFGYDRPIDRVMFEERYKQRLERLLIERELTTHPAIVGSEPIYSNGELSLPGL